jgi:hypothetical protein
MRATKGLWAAVGAGTSLAAAGVLALFSVSLVLAVRGWPQVGVAGSGDAVELRAQVASAPASATSAAPQAATQVVVAGARRARRHVTARPNPDRGGLSAPGRGPGAAAPSRQPAAGSSAPVLAAPSPSPSPSGGAPIVEIPQVAGDTITNVTAEVGDVVRPISPPVADTVTKTGDQAGDVVQQVGDTVGGLVGGLTGASRP